jgi:protein involved in polysaccharide export with SLBB domain
MARCRVLLSLIGALFLLGVLCGCTSYRGDDLSYLLARLDESVVAGDEDGADSPEAPDMPMDELPSPEDVPAANVTAPPPGSFGEVTIQPDTVLEIDVKEDKTLAGVYTVNEIGAIQLGYVGPVILLELTARGAEEKIRSVLESRDFRNATVTVKVVRASYDKIRVMGKVGSKGLIKIGAGEPVPLESALRRAGGITGSPSSTRVKVIRNGLLSPFGSSLGGETYSLVDNDGRPRVPDVMLRNNDVVVVYQWTRRGGAGRRGGGGRYEGDMSTTILLLGEVGRQGYVSFRPGEPATIMHLVFKIGGFPLYANDRAVRIIRRDDDGSEYELVVDAKEIFREGNPDYDVPLEDGDRVIVPARRISLF